MNTTRTIVAILALTLAALGAQAQKAFVPESMVPRAGGEFGLPTFDTDMTLTAEPKSMEEMWAADIVSGLSLRRTVKTQRQDVFGKGMEDTPLFYLLNQQETLDLSAAITERSRFTYTRQSNRQMDLLGRERAYSEYAGWGLQQQFGAGSTAMTLGFKRGIREQHSGGGQVSRTAEQAWSLAGGLGTVGNLSLNFATTTPEQKSGTSTQALQTSLTRAFSGGQGKFAFSRSLAERGAWEQAIYKADLSLPLAVRGGTAKFTYHRDSKVVAGSETANRQATFATPLAWWSKDASLTWQLTGKVKGASATEQRTTTAVLPLRLFDRRIGNTFTDQRITAGNTVTHRQAWVWKVPFEKTHLTFGYTHQTPYSADGKPGPRTRIETVQVPMLRVFTDRVHASFSQTRTETVGGATVRTTHIGAQVQPIDKLKLVAQVQEQDRGPGTVTQTMTLRSDFAVSERLSLNWRYLERQQVGLSPHIERYVGVQHKLPTSLPVQMRFGYTSYGSPGNPEQDAAYAAQLAVGKSDKTSLSATYLQFQEKDLKPLPDDVIQLALTHHFSAATALRAEYQDQPGRVAPLRGLVLQTPALGGSLRISHYTNPQDPRNKKRVREGDQWDAELKREIGRLALQLDYRYCEYERDLDRVEQYLKLALAGGKPSRGGQLSLAYATGDFAPPSPRRGDPLPGSTLELSYRKQWSAAQLTLSLRRTTAPWGKIDPEGYSEGRLELKALW